MKKGFTLIELMIVVAIIAIIAAIAIPSLLRSRMAANETAAAASCKAFAEAEEIYHRTDYNHDGVLEYATVLHGNNSLLESTSGLGDLALIDKSFGLAEGDQGGGANPAVPKAGYVFSLLTGQGVAATGGLRCYVTPAVPPQVAPHMTLGYALSAIAAAYDGTGRDAFIINNNGTIFQKDRTSSVPGHETVFNPDTTTGTATGGWTPAD
jgi:prepilin-type N-terminal cleavage/methylation domain-containing protein